MPFPVELGEDPEEPDYRFWVIGLQQPLVVLAHAFGPVTPLPERPRFSEGHEALAEEEVVNGAVEEADEGRALGKAAPAVIHLGRRAR